MKKNVFIWSPEQRGEWANPGNVTTAQKGSFPVLHLFFKLDLSDDDSHL